MTCDFCGKEKEDVEERPPFPEGEQVFTTVCNDCAVALDMD